MIAHSRLSDGHLLAMSQGGGGRELGGVSFIKALIQFMRAHDLSNSQRLHLHIPSHWRLGFNMNLGGNTPISL